METPHAEASANPEIGGIGTPLLTSLILDHRVEDVTEV